MEGSAISQESPLKREEKLVHCTDVLTILDDMRQCMNVWRREHFVDGIVAAALLVHSTALRADERAK
jgi:hypothetical protein